YYIHKAIEIWGKADPLLDQIIPIGERLHQIIHANEAKQEEINVLLKTIQPVNYKLTALEDDFSYTLEEGSRWLENLILKTLLSLVLRVEFTGIMITITVSRGISKGLNEIIDGARLITRGFLDRRVKVFSRDEIGRLAISFNMMTDNLEQNIRELKE